MTCDASIHPSVKIHESAKIEPYVRIGPNVEIGANSVVEAFAVIHRNTIIGKGNVVSSFSSIGGHSQSRHDSLEDDSFLIVGDNNTFHEYCSINRGSIHSSSKTIIGNNNIFMAYTHVGHDCVIGDNVVLVNQATLAGHVEINSHAVVGYSSAVRQFCKVGFAAFIGESATIVKDVMPYIIVRGSPTRVAGINKVGLNRLNLSDDEISIINTCFRLVFRKKLTCEQAISEIRSLNIDYPSVQIILEMIEESKRGLVR